MGREEGLMESIDKLREYGHECCARIDDAVHDLADAIEAEIAERFMELPVDVDGVPIHVGDWLRHCDLTVQCAAVSPERVYYWDEAVNGHWVLGVKCRHVKPRTLEDVLDEFTSAYDQIGGEDDEHWKYLEISKRYADEIRELLGVDT